jgi:prepilin-type N-terminal cleavage/methylation domain-containing protein
LEANVKAERKTVFRPQRTRGEQGFTLVEVMISMVVLTIGLLSMLGVFGIAMASTQTSQENAIAKQLANEAMEGILTARETANVTWAAIQNTGSGGIFVPGFVPVDCAGVDGIIGTADDAACGPQILEQPGSSGVYAGTCPPDVCYPLTNYSRQILISSLFDGGGNLIPSLRSVTITMQYTTAQLKTPKQYVLTTYISQYR